MINFRFEKYDTISSTNDFLLEKLDEGIIDKDIIVVAREQTDGHGTKGKNFISVKDKGIYFSFLHFYNDINELSFITQKVAVAVYKTFKTIFDMELSIKWVNDLYYNDKKICGIFCKNKIKDKAVIIGIGIDLFKNENIDESIKDIAGYIFKDKYELLDILDTNAKLNKESCVYKNIYNDFKTLKLEGIEINDQNLWEADHLVIDIVMNIYDLLNKNGLPDIYVEKNIIKDKRIYEDCNLEC